MCGKEDIRTMLKWNEVMEFARKGNPAPDHKVVKTEAEWRSQLSPAEYRVTLEAATERAFSSPMCNLFEPGIYSCVCCDTVLFEHNRKIRFRHRMAIIHPAGEGKRHRLSYG